MIKRGFDLLVSGAGLVVFSPIALLITIAIKLEDRGPVLFTQERVGRHGRVFLAY
ncbi:MAG: sugar transferase, partial [Acidobacteriota bacterium]|nr:sugar transferase [Acidobacteriota bacterium]